jgi:hypothetical protein
MSTRELSVSSTLSWHACHAERGTLDRTRMPGQHHGAIGLADDSSPLGCCEPRHWPAHGGLAIEEAGRRRVFGADTVRVPSFRVSALLKHSQTTETGGRDSCGRVVASCNPDSEAGDPAGPVSNRHFPGYLGLFLFMVSMCPHKISRSRVRYGSFGETG